MGVIKDQLRADLTAAMKNRDEFAKSTLRMALAAIQYAEVAGDEACELSEADEIKLLAKEAKNREETAATYAEAGREELADKESKEAAFLRRYLPQPLSEEELGAIVKTEIEAMSLSLGDKPSMKNMGAIVKAVNAKTAGRADGKTVAQMVRAHLD